MIARHQRGCSRHCCAAEQTRWFAGRGGGDGYRLEGEGAVLEVAGAEYAAVAVAVIQVAGQRIGGSAFEGEPVDYDGVWAAAGGVGFAWRAEFVDVDADVEIGISLGDNIGIGGGGGGGDIWVCRKVIGMMILVGGIPIFGSGSIMVTTIISVVVLVLIMLVLALHCRVGFIDEK